MPVVDPKDQKLLEHIDTALKRLQNNVQVEMPYFLTSASKETGNRVSPYNWHKDSFFERDEEHLQYQTWYYREDAEDLCCLELHSGIEEERRRADKAKQSTSKYQRSASISTVSSPGESYQSTPKKKISFQEYQKRKLGGGGENSMSPDVRVATKIAQQKANGVHKSQKTSTDRLADHPSLLSAELSSKRKREADAQADHKRAISNSVKMLPKTATAANRSSNHHSNSLGEIMDPFDLPDLLSPTFDHPTQNPPFGFPPLLSPLSSLPASFRQDLATHKSQHDTDDLDETPTRQSFPSSKGTRPRSDTKISKGSASARDLEDEERVSSPVRRTSPNRTIPPTTAATHKASADKRSLTVVLRLGRKRRKELQKLFESSSQQKEPLLESPARKQPLKRRDEPDLSSEDEPLRTKHRTTNGIVREALSRDSSHTKHSETRTPGETKKRMREDDVPDTPSKKRTHQASATSLDHGIDAHIPVKVEHLSPVATHKRSESIRSQPGAALTPMKDIKATSMSRTHSAESMITTPQISGSTPGPSGKAPTSAPMINGVNVKSQSPLRWMEREISMVGKKLKTHFQDINDKVRGGAKVMEAERKMGAMAGLESVLSYILLFASQEANTHNTATAAGKKPPLASPGSYGNWYTLLPLFNLVSNLTREFPHLSGLQSHVGVGIANAVFIRWNQLGSANRRSEETCARSGSQTLTPLEVLERLMRELPTWSSESVSKLDVNEIIDEFPKTWALRTSTTATGGPTDSASKKSLAHDWENDLLKHATAWKEGRPLKQGKVSIILAVDSGPVQVVRFACAILKEYAEREKLDYTLSLKI